MDHQKSHSKPSFIVCRRGFRATAAWRERRWRRRSARCVAMGPAPTAALRAPSGRPSIWGCCCARPAPGCTATWASTSPRQAFVKLPPNLQQTVVAKYALHNTELRLCACCCARPAPGSTAAWASTSPGRTCFVVLAPGAAEQRLVAVKLSETWQRNGRHSAQVRSVTLDEEVRERSLNDSQVSCMNRLHPSRCAA